MRQELPRTNLRITKRPARSTLGAVMHVLKGIILSPLYSVLATIIGVPGMTFRWRIFLIGITAVFRFRNRLTWNSIFHLLFMPMESTRYFEFDFAGKALKQRTAECYLDISSPRLFPVALLIRRPALLADLINPDLTDLYETQRFVNFIGATDRCRLHGCLIADAPCEVESFDTITSLSVLEHIPDDTGALASMWKLLKPGGALILTLPCMATASDQYIDQDNWGLLQHDNDGYVFWQRFYDTRMMEERVFRITGRPHTVAIYGETYAGALFDNTLQKRTDPYYPYWREPYMMARNYRYFDSVDKIPGEGVIGLLFLK